MHAIGQLVCFDYPWSSIRRACSLENTIFSSGKFTFTCNSCIQILVPKAYAQEIVWDLLDTPIYEWNVKACRGLASQLHYS